MAVSKRIYEWCLWLYEYNHIRYLLPLAPDTYCRSGPTQRISAAATGISAALEAESSLTKTQVKIMPESIVLIWVPRGDIDSRSPVAVQWTVNTDHHMTLTFTATSALLYIQWTWCVYQPNESKIRLFITRDCWNERKYRHYTISCAVTVFTLTIQTHFASLSDLSAPLLNSYDRQRNRSIKSSHSSSPT